MARDEPTMEALRVELSNLRDDLAVIESSEVFAINAIAIKRRSMPLDIGSLK